MSTGKLGFVLIPDRRALCEAIRLSEAIDGNQLQLDLSWRLPHVTLLQTYFRKDFDYKKELKRIRDHRGFKFEAYSRFEEITAQDTEELRSIIWWNVANTGWLKRLNRELIETFEEFIIKPELSAELEFPNAAARRSYELTGYSRNLEAYEPHITLGISEINEKLPNSPLKKEFIRFRTLAFVEHGPMGQISKILASEELPISWD